MTNDNNQGYSQEVGNFIGGELSVEMMVGNMVSMRITHLQAWPLDPL